MADNLGEPAPLWPHDPDAKEVSRLFLTWGGGVGGLPVSAEATDASSRGSGRWGARHCTRPVGGSSGDVQGPRVWSNRRANWEDVAGPGEPFKQDKSEVVVGGSEKGFPPDVGHITSSPSLDGGGRKQGPGPGLEQGKGGPATASGLGPSPIPVLRPQKPLHLPGGDGHRGKSLKLLEKIPEDAEATVVLVGKDGWALGAGAWGSPQPPLGSAGLELWPAGCLSLPHPCTSQPVSAPALSSLVLCLLPCQLSVLWDNC